MPQVLTAWCGFQSSQWNGRMSVAFSEASSARIEAARQAGVANAACQADLTIWGVYVQARAQVMLRSHAMWSSASRTTFGWRTRPGVPEANRGAVRVGVVLRGCIDR